MTHFEGVAPLLAQALSKRGYESLTPVQLAVLGPDLAEADLLVSAQTGSGKTVAFGIAIAPTLLDADGMLPSMTAPGALVIAPTRELALQVKRELEWLFAATGARIASCVGGMDMRTERRALQQGAQIVVGTPGRLRDHIERGSLDMTALKAVVLDEADEMLDLGFRDDLEYMLDTSPANRRTLMFSATVPRTILGMAKRYQRDAVRINTQSDKKQHVDIEYRALTMAPTDRENAIINVLRYHDAPNAIIFCGTRMNVNHMKSRLNNRGFSVVALSGELSQNERSHALQAMRDGRARVCVATDVAARGIDLPGLELVIHADIPKNKEILLHRSGRTGRAGRKGTCALIVPYNWRKRTERLLDNASINAVWAKPPSVEDIAKSDRTRFLANPALSEPVTEDEQEFVAELTKSHSAEQLAAALIRLQNTNQPAAEELSDNAPVDGRPERKPRREDFSGGEWISLSVGHKHKAEPRWLLPTLCRAGHITKKDIGSIKIQQNETHVELAPGVMEKFLEAVGPSRKIEKTITVDVLRAPKAQREDTMDPEARSERSERPRRDRNPRGDRDSRSDRGGRSDRGDRGGRGERDGGGRDRKPFADKKPYGKKSFGDDKKPYGDKPKPYGDKPKYDEKAKSDYKKTAPKKTDSGPAKPVKTPVEETPSGKYKKKPKWTADQKRAAKAAKEARLAMGDEPKGKKTKKNTDGSATLKRKKT